MEKNISDTSLIDINVQPSFVRITLKGKVFQLVFDKVVSPDNTSAKRSQVTGSLVLTLPKAETFIRSKKNQVGNKISSPFVNETTNDNKKFNSKDTKCEKLEIEEKKIPDIYNICVPANGEVAKIMSRNKNFPNHIHLKALENFTDDYSVPPLE